MISGGEWSEQFGANWSLPRFPRDMAGKLGIRSNKHPAKKGDKVTKHGDLLIHRY